ncbi:MAG: T9SS type A sorting domain-containing protein [Lewinellaceae bacterium]|nr:T9SS type A sorting domain-containing protein [Lewinellaceae bacterium]
MKLMKNHKQQITLATAMLWVLFVMTSGMQVFGQGFEYNYGSNKEDQGQAILQTDDRGYLLAGYSESFGSDNDLDVYVIRTDVDGQLIWEKIYDEGFIEHAYGMDATQDGGYIIVGDIRPTALDSFDVYLLKIDLHGNLLWSSQFGGSGFEQGFDVKATSDGGFLIVGRQINQQNGDLDIYVVKADATGNLVWEKTFGGAGDDEGWSAEEVSDGYVVGGNAINPNTNSSDIYVLKLNYDGDVIWDYYFDYPDTFEQGFGLTVASDGGFVVAGHRGFVEIFAAKLSEDGQTELWNKSFTVGVGGQANDVVETNDGNYVLGGIAETTAANIDLFIAKVNATNGDEIWTHTIGRTNIIDWTESLVQRVDGGFALAGWNGQEALVFINDVKLIKADSDGRVRTNYLNGKVYADWNQDNTQDPGEPGMRDWVVEANGTNGSWYGTTDENGFFSILVDTGTYDVKVDAKGTNWESAYPVINGLPFPETYDTIDVEFPMYVIDVCPTLFVDISTDAVIACENSTFDVTYRNEGTATATGVKVELALDLDWTFVNASIPATPEGNNVYSFQVGDLATSEGGNFQVTLSADCNAPIGTNFFVQAHITPDEICTPATGWDGSNVAVSGSCQGDTVVFELRNTSINPMTNTLDYIVIEDEIMGKTEFQLPGEDVMLVKRYANGSTFRIVAEQSPNHPGNSRPSVVVEGCMAAGVTESTTGMVNMFPEDEGDTFLAVDAQESIEPNATIDLRAYPKGYLGDTIAANVDIEYHVRFQNTTNDTLFWVAVRDSLPLEHLNIATIQPGASSHPYRFQAYDNGVVKFVFESIVLPPASVNPDASKGFIQFKISQQPDLPKNTEIFNKALLFVGYDEVPVESVQKRHVIGGANLEDFVIITDDREVLIPGVSVKVYPNPMDGQSTIVVEGMTFSQLDLKLYDAAGRLVRQERSTGNQITLNKGNLKTGTYFFVLEGNSQALKTGKVIVK